MDRRESSFSIVAALWFGSAAVIAAYPVSMALRSLMIVLMKVIGQKLPATPVSSLYLYLPAVLIAAGAGGFLAKRLLEYDDTPSITQTVWIGTTITLIASIVGAPIVAFFADFQDAAFKLGTFFLMAPFISILGTLVTCWITVPVGIVAAILLRFRSTTIPIRSSVMLSPKGQ